VHRYALFDGGEPVGSLEWRSRPRTRTGWYLARDARPSSRLSVDPGVDELAADTGSDAMLWGVEADATAILSASLALDAAERTIHPPRPHLARPARRPARASRCRVYVEGIDSVVLARAVPELAVSRRGDVSVLDGVLDTDGLAKVLRRLRLLGGAVLPTRPESSE
jgi:hypothetical protein